MILWPLTTSTSSSATDGADFSAGNGALKRPCVESYFSEVGEVVGGHEVVDGDDVECLAEQALFDQGAKDEATDAAETVDANFDHLRTP